jgi:hypothetical protein
LTKQDKINNLESRMYKAVRTDHEGIEHRKDINLAKNDIITFTRNEYKEYDLRNGERGKILEAKEKSLKIELEDRRKITLDTEKYKHIDYGYALTTYKAQGQTYNKVVVEADTNVPSLLDMRNQYVNITRARDDIKIFSDDKQDLKELADIKTHAKDTFCRPDITLDQAKKSEDQLWTNIRNRTDKKIIELQLLTDLNDYRQHEPVIVKNENILKAYSYDKEKKEKLKLEMEKITKALNLDKKLSIEEKKKIANYLNSDESKKEWYKSYLSVEEKIQRGYAYIKGQTKEQNMERKRGLEL